MIIGIDFDGTCVTHEFPNVGQSIGAERVLRRLVEAGHQLILFTMRSDIESVSTADPSIQPVSGNHLTAAIEWFQERGIPLWGVNENPEQKSWTGSPKPYCHIYIDDAALGCPLIYTDNGKAFVDWAKVDRMLAMLGVLK